MRVFRRIADFIFVCCTAVVLWMAAVWMSPVLELAAPMGAVLGSLVLVNLVDGVRFAVRRGNRAGHTTVRQRSNVSPRVQQQPAA